MLYLYTEVTCMDLYVLATFSFKVNIKNYIKGRGRWAICKTHQAFIQPLRWIPHWCWAIFHPSNDLEEGKKSGDETLPSSLLWSIYFSVLRGLVLFPFQIWMEHFYYFLSEEQHFFSGQTPPYPVFQISNWEKEEEEVATTCTVVAKMADYLWAGTQKEIA